MPLVAGEIQKGLLSQVRGRTWLNLRLRILATELPDLTRAALQNEVLSIPMKWNYFVSASSPCNSAYLQLCMNASISQKTQDHFLNMLDSQ
jgi:hypothetical protein